MGRSKLSYFDSFMEKVEIIPEHPCWEWIASKRTGYGNFRNKPAHRVSLKLFKNIDVPKGMDAMHSCDNRGCVNPMHLSVGTRKQNVDDMLNKRRHRNHIKTHCAQGHPYDEHNTYWHPRGWRQCKECQRIRMRAKR